MTDLSPFMDLTMTIDVQEKKEDRVNRARMHMENLGVTVKRGSVKDYDYEIIGEFKGFDLSLGIEYKTIDDLTSNWQALPERFARAFEHVDYLALIVEGRIATTRHDDGKLYVENTTSDTTGELMPYAAFQSKWLQWTMNSGIYVWNIATVRDFGPSIENLVNHICNVPHTLLAYPKKDWRRQRFAYYQNIPGVGGKTAIALVPHNVRYWIEHKDELLKVAKPAKTKQILEFMGYE